MYVYVVGAHTHEIANLKGGGEKFANKQHKQTVAMN